jgi:succinyl-CoA synthetase beta subunit
VVIKAQVHSGGRGKAGGVQLARNPGEAADHASHILGMTIKGLVVHRVLVVPAADIASESYVGIIMDRATQKPVFMVSSAGGIDIEEVAARTPEKILKMPVDPVYGLLPHQALTLAFALYKDFAQVRAAARMMEQLYRVFADNGASLAEINPLVTTPDQRVLALDAKISIDDNELDRRPDLDGNVGCVVNGAGLAMATMDLVKYYGGEPANFLDIGGSSNPEKVISALKIITSDPNVKAILFNIFGGITRTDDVANGLVAATQQFKVKVPIVIRLTGTNEAAAIKILEAVGMRALSDMDQAVEQVVRLARDAA